MDASSAFQNHLPLSSDNMLSQLDALGLKYQRFDHIPLFTVAESKQVRDGLLRADQGGGHIKNLFMRDHKKQNYLVVFHEDREIALTDVASKIGAGRLSFGSPKRLLEILGVCPGAVTPLSMVNGANHNVKLYLDKYLQDAHYIYMHPLVNDRTIAMTPRDLEVFLRAVNAHYWWVDFDDI